MSLHQYFKTKDGLQDPMGSFLASVETGAIVSANREVEKALKRKQNRRMQTWPLHEVNSYNTTYTLFAWMRHDDVCGTNMMFGLSQLAWLPKFCKHKPKILYWLIERSQLV